MQPQFSDLDLDQQEAFRLYKLNSPFEGELCFADYMNQALRELRDLPERWNNKIQILDELIASASTDTDISLFRATVDSFVQPFIQGDDIIYPAYMSTSSDEYGVRRHFSGNYQNATAALLRIYSPVGSTVLDLETNPALLAGQEEELLLPRNSRFTIVNIKDIVDRDEMNAIMSDLYAKNFSSLKIYEIEYVKRDI